MAPTAWGAVRASEIRDDIQELRADNKALGQKTGQILEAVATLPPRKHWGPGGGKAGLCQDDGEG